MERPRIEGKRKFDRLDLMSDRPQMETYLDFALLVTLQLTVQYDSLPWTPGQCAGRADNFVLMKQAEIDKRICLPTAAFLRL
jgi:hypothetical protein